MNNNVSIRPALLGDAEAMYEAMELAQLQNFSFFDRPVTLERQESYLGKMHESTTDQLFAIHHDNKIVGTCGLHEIDWSNKNARVGVMIFSSQFRGKSIGSTAMRQMMAVSFEGMHLYKLYLKVFADNRASTIKYIHLGFEFEARLRKHYCLKGVYHDMNVMSIFQDEWDKGVQN